MHSYADFVGWVFHALRKSKAHSSVDTQVPTGTAVTYKKSNCDKKRTANDKLFNTPSTTDTGESQSPKLFTIQRILSRDALFWKQPTSGKSESGSEKQAEGVGTPRNRCFNCFDPSSLSSPAPTPESGIRYRGPHMSGVS